MAPLDRDLLDAENTADPYGYLSQLRVSDPVHWDPRQKAWLITKYDDVVAGLSDPRLSSDRIKPLLELVPERRRAELTPMLGVMSDWMVVSDAPAHTRLRSLANGAFRAQRIVKMGEWIGEIVDNLLDEFLASGSTDFVNGLAYPMPATVIAKMLGAPEADKDLFQRWSDELALVAFGAGGEARNDRHTRALSGVAEMQAYLHDLIDKVEREPGEDMVSALIANPAPDDRLSRDELVALCSLILFAGHETTTNLLCNATVALTANPEQLQAVRNDPSLVNGAVEEVLRYEGPIKLIVRWVTEDLEIGGVRIPAGDRAYLLLNSANRDEGTFPDADRFDITRADPAPHVAFGRGAHACLGAQLARIEARIALPKILQALPGLRLADPVAWKPSLSSRAVDRLHVDYDGRATPAKVG
ncbi:cytochrome P450 [Streptomyces sp. NPDC046805]|uniref:cytochrome P450 n=1 Tax=Streptomyces sp. NPDC046805 TaxID=3155134 RepID=UPI0033EFCD9E